MKRNFEQCSPPALSKPLRFGNAGTRNGSNARSSGQLGLQKGRKEEPL
jgi:hypothetical protein